MTSPNDGDGLIEPVAGLTDEGDVFAFLVRTPPGPWWRQAQAARLLAQRHAPLEQGLTLRLVRARPWRLREAGVFFAQFTRRAAPRGRGGKPWALAVASLAAVAVPAGAVGAMALIASREPAPRAVEAPPPPPRLPALTLVGVMIEADTRVAIIADESGAVAVAKEGEAVAGGVLERVRADGAIVRFAQGSLALRFAPESAPEVSAEPPHADDAAAPPETSD